jgi:hypothetical protein
MNRIWFVLGVLTILSLASCKKVIDQLPQSNLYDEVFYQNVQQFDAALVGCYNGMQKPMLDEWALTELRSDNTIMGNPTSASIPNRELSDLDMFVPNAYHERVYSYWLNTYYNIFNANKIFKNLAVSYDTTNGSLSYTDARVVVSESDRKRIAAQASFIRAYHYFNLVRLYGGVFLIHQPVTAAESKFINRSSVDAIYKLIIADLNNAIENGDGTPYSIMNAASLGRASRWSAKALLAKVYLTLNRKSEAIQQLQDVITQGGFGLQTRYTDVFSISNEMNTEILFAVRYKSGRLGLGSPFANLFAPSSSGNYIVNGDGNAYNYPSYDLDSIRPNSSGFVFDTLRPNAYERTDPRRIFNIKRYGSKIYCNKYILYDDINQSSPLLYQDDGESDWPVLRYADVLLMMAEAQGFNTASVQLINLIRSRVGLTPVSPANQLEFEKCLSRERRFEFAFENQRWFDLLRFNVTLRPQTAENTLKSHFTYMYINKGGNHYNQYLPPIVLNNLLAQINADKLLLPIPQREIDNNTNMVIMQNPGY